MSTVPKRVEYLAGIVCRQVTCGFAYTAAVTTEGQVWLPLQVRLSDNVILSNHSSAVDGVFRFILGAQGKMAV